MRHEIRRGKSSARLYDRNQKDFRKGTLQRVGHFARTMINIICVSESIKSGEVAFEKRIVNDGESEHVVNDSYYFITIKLRKVRLELADISATTTSKKGTLVIETNFEWMTLIDVYYVFILKLVIARFGEVIKHGLTITFEKSSCVISDRRTSHSVYGTVQ